MERQSTEEYEFVAARFAQRRACGEPPQPVRLIEIAIQALVDFRSDHAPLKE